jgi:hypothetical protein
MTRKRDAGKSLMRAREIVMEVFGENEGLFRDEMRRMMALNPAAFYSKFVVPLMPRQFEIETSDKAEKVLDTQTILETIGRAIVKIDTADILGGQEALDVTSREIAVDTSSGGSYDRTL